MDAFYLSTSEHADTRLCIAPLSRQMMDAAGISASEAGGYFLVERTGSKPEKFEVLAQVPTEDAAVRLARLLNLT